MSNCKCDLRTRLVGDGCQHCNPQLAIDYLSEQVQELEAEIAQMRLTDKEFGVMAAVASLLGNFSSYSDHASTLRRVADRLSLPHQKE